MDKQTSSTFEMINENCHIIPAVVSIPHSGTRLTESMKMAVKPDAVLANMDWYLPRLYSFLGELGFTVIINHISRYVIDVNRPLAVNPESDSYTGQYIYTKTTFGREIYSQPLSKCEIDKRVRQYYAPYHRSLDAAVEAKLARFACVVVIDLHSFGAPLDCDVVLGNRHGGTCSGKLFEYAARTLARCGFTVSRNKPYSGGYITQKYAGTPCEALQLELNYRAYISHGSFEEEELPPIDDGVFVSAQARLRNFFLSLKDYLTVCSI